MLTPKFLNYYSNESNLKIIGHKSETKYLTNEDKFLIEVLKKKFLNSSKENALYSHENNIKQARIEPGDPKKQKLQKDSQNPFQNKKHRNVYSMLFPAISDQNKLNQSNTMILEENSFSSPQIRYNVNKEKYANNMETPQKIIRNKEYRDSSSKKSYSDLTRNLKIPISEKKKSTKDEKINKNFKKNVVRVTKKSTMYLDDILKPNTNLLEHIRKIQTNAFNHINCMGLTAPQKIPFYLSKDNEKSTEILSHRSEDFARIMALQDQSLKTIDYKYRVSFIDNVTILF